MNPLTQSKNTTTLPVLIALTLGCFGLSPQARAVDPPPDGCYPNFTTAEGCNALFGLGAGTGDTAIGWYSLFSVGDGSFNTGVGAGALALTSGAFSNNNTAVGTGAMLLNLSGNNNTAVGNNALLFNSTAFYNNAVGSFALWNNDSSGHGSANYNNALGRGALESNIDGAANTAFGDQALFYSDGDYNVAVGDYAGTGLFIASNVIAIGAGVTGADTILGEVNDSCYIGNIYTGTVPNAGVPLLVFVDPDGKLGTTSVDAAGNKFQIPVQTLQRTAMLDQKVEEQQVTITELKSTVAQLTAQLKEQASQIQKVSAQLEASKPPLQVVNNP